MPAKSLEAQVRHQPRVAVVDLQGEIDSFAEDVLNAAYAEAETRDANVILLLCKVDYINSQVSLSLSVYWQEHEIETPLASMRIEQSLRRIFQITRLVDFMSVFRRIEALAGGSNGFVYI
jgi:anti-anti-sigma factor